MDSASNSSFAFLSMSNMTAEYSEKRKQIFSYTRERGEVKKM